MVENGNPSDLSDGVFNVLVGLRLLGAMFSISSVSLVITVIVVYKKHRPKREQVQRFSLYLAIAYLVQVQYLCERTDDLVSWR